MSGVIVITRPEPDASDYARELDDAGYQSFVEPMLRIDSVSFDKPNLAAYDGVIVTSANAVEHYVRGGGIVGDVSVYCVGKHTAAAARDAGFLNVISVDGIGADLLSHIREIEGVQEKRFLHLCGCHVAFPIVDKLQELGVYADAVVVYKSVQADALSEKFLSTLREGDVSVVTFFSRRTAEAFVNLVRVTLSESESQSLFASIKSLSISDAVLECVRVLPWHENLVAKRPDRVEMMKLLKARV